MIPTSFDESNAFLSAPADMPDCEPLSIFRDEKTPSIISCWKLTKEELEEVNRTGRIWLRVFGAGMPPVYLSGETMFEGPK